MKRWALLLCLLLLPSVAAQTTEDLIWAEGEEGELKTWRIYEDNFNNGGISSFSDNATWFKFTSLDKAIPQSVLFVEIRFTVTLQSVDDGDWNYTFETNTNNTWDGCNFILSTRDPGVLGGSPVTYATYSIFCADTIADLAEDQEFTWWLNRTVESGNPDTPIAQHLTLKMDRGDFVVYPMDINITNLETWIPIVFWVTALGLALWFDWTWTAAFSVPGLLYSLFPLQIPGGFEEYLLLAVVGLALEYFSWRRERKLEESNL